MPCGPLTSFAKNAVPCGMVCLSANLGTTASSHGSGNNVEGKAMQKHHHCLVSGFCAVSTVLMPILRSASPGDAVDSKPLHPQTPKPSASTGRLFSQSCLRCLAGRALRAHVGFVEPLPAHQRCEELHPGSGLRHDVLSRRNVLQDGEESPQRPRSRIGTPRAVLSTPASRQKSSTEMPRKPDALLPRLSAVGVGTVSSASSFSEGASPPPRPPRQLPRSHWRERCSCRCC